MNRTTFLINVPVDASIEEDRGGVWDWFVLAQVGGLPASSSLIHNRVSKVKDGTENRGSIDAIIRLVLKTVSLVTRPSCRCSRLRIRPQLLTKDPPVLLPPNTKRWGYNGWDMFDMGDFAVHVLSRDARQKYFEKMGALGPQVTMTTVGFPTIRCSSGVEHVTNDSAYYKGPPTSTNSNRTPLTPRERSDDEPRPGTVNCHVHRAIRRPLHLTNPRQPAHPPLTNSRLPQRGVCLLPPEYATPAPSDCIRLNHAPMSPQRLRAHPMPYPH